MQKFPVAKPYKYANIRDFKGDKDGMVKVPILRNIAQTAPYYHNGAVWSLKKAVKLWAKRNWVKNYQIKRFNLL